MELGLYRIGCNYGNLNGKVSYARDRMRRMARLLKQIRLDLGEDDLKLTDILTPENFDLLVNAAFDLGKLSCSTQEATPHSTKRIEEDLMKAS